MGEWSGEIEPAVHNLGNATNGAGFVPVVVVYNVPNRDCGQYSKGGSTSPAAYKKWIADFARGAGSFRMIVVLEPDALGLLTKCLSLADQKARVAMMKDAVDVLEGTPGVSVYIDAGHANWIAAGEMAKRLKAAGIANADGFALNVSNYVASSDNIEYGRAISALLGSKHFIIDTGRNGNGATADAEWCNPKGRALGTPPTTDTGDPLVDAFFWIKPPGESDGECNGGPKAGEFWPEAALELVKAAK
jgi:endoglucanase